MKPLALVIALVAMAKIETAVITCERIMCVRNLVRFQHTHRSRNVRSLYGQMN